MAYHPLNLGLRFLLELAALAALAIWGADRGGAILAVALPLVGAVLWGTFRVPGDASASGNAPVAVPGVVRLALELALFGAAAAALVDAGHTTAGIALAVIAALHYTASYDRIVWLLQGESEEIS